MTSITAYRAFESNYSTAEGSPANVTLQTNRVYHWQLSEELRLNGSLGDASISRSAATISTRAATMTPASTCLRRPPVSTSSRTISFPRRPKRCSQPPTGRSSTRCIWSAASATPRSRKPSPMAAAASQAATDVSGELQQRRPGRNLPNRRRSSGRRSFAQQRDADLFRRPDGLPAGAAIPLDAGPYDLCAVCDRLQGGGVNPRPFFLSQAQNFGPETLDAYEVGLKGDFFDDMLRLNASAFVNKYEDILVTIGPCPVRRRSTVGERGERPAPCRSMRATPTLRAPRWRRPSAPPTPSRSM